MTAPLSMDLRERLFVAVEGGQSRRSAAKRFGVAPSTAIKWLALWRQDGHVDPTIADALLDRLVHNAYRIELAGDSLRKAKGPPTLEPAA